ncbi:MAG TPA: hypothetical protein VI479_04405 [Blastocatellia bacterium]
MNGPRSLLAVAVRMMPADRREWGAAMLAELAHLQNPFTRWRFALGCARVALFAPRKGGALQFYRTDAMKNFITNFGSAAIISFLILLPFMILAFMFEVVKRLNIFSFRNAIDLIVVFGLLWLGLASIILIVAPIVRNMREGNDNLANPALTRGNALTNILTNPGWAAIISFLLALPFMAIVSLLLLDIEPPLAALINNPDPDQPDVLGLLIISSAFLLSVLACVIVRAPIVRTMRAGGSLLAHPVNLTLAVVILSFITIPLIALIADQFPCWIGVPNCD